MKCVNVECDEMLKGKMYDNKCLSKYEMDK